MSERARFVRHEELPGAAQSKKSVDVYVISVDGRELRKRFSEFDALRARLIAAGCPGARAARLPSKIKKSVARRSGALPAFLNELPRAVGGGSTRRPRGPGVPACGRWSLPPRYRHRQQPRRSGP